MPPEVITLPTVKADGAVVSITNVVSVTVLESLPAASLTLTVSELYVPAARVSNIIVVLPLIAFAGAGEVIVCDTYNEMLKIANEIAGSSETPRTGGTQGFKRRKLQINPVTANALAGILGGTAGSKTTNALNV